MSLYGPTENTLSLPSLIANDNPVILKKTIVANAGAARVAGTVLGRISSGGKLDNYDNNDNDGTEVAIAILLEDVAASATDTEALVGFAGVYRQAGLTGLDAAGILDLEARGIYVK